MAARDADGGTGSARRRTERRLRSWAKHERLSVAMALTVKLHHSANRADLPKEEEQHHAARGQMPARAERHAVEHLADLAPLVQILDAPVPQVADKMLDVFRAVDSAFAEQVIEVPFLSCSSCPSRSPFLEPQLAEQLVDVPTVLSVVSLKRRTVEQPVHFPVLRGRSGRRLQGSLPRQSSTAAGAEQSFDIPVRGGLHCFSQDRYRRSALWSSSLTVLLEVFKIFTSVRALQLHPLFLRMRFLQWVFALFPK